jgi:transposase
MSSAERVSKKTFLLDKRIEKKLRYMQAQLIVNDDEANWSLSKIINLLLLRALLESGNDFSHSVFLKDFLEGKSLNIENDSIDGLIEKLIGEP